MSEQTEESITELTTFERAIIELRSKPLSLYCEEDISKLQCDVGTIKCALGKVREKIVRSANCIGYNWESKQKPAIVSGFTTFIANLEEEVHKLEESLQKRKTEIDNNRAEIEKKFANRFIPGWEPDGWKPTK